MDLKARIAQNLRRIRVEKRMTQEDLAGAASIDRTYVSGIENAGFNPSVEIIERLARVLEIDPVELVREPGGNQMPVKGMPSGRKAKV